MEAATAPTGAPRDRRLRARAVPIGGFLVIAATVAWGLIAEAAGVRLGMPSPPLLYVFKPALAPLALPALAVIAGCAVAAPRLRAPAVSPARFAAAALVIGLALRLALAAARGGVDAWYAIYEVPNFESVNEYLPALPALDFGLRFFLDTFAEVGTALPVHAVGHPPGLLATLHLLGIESAEGMAALTIGVGALSIPLAYLLARELLDEARARNATLLYVFAPSAVIGGATSADALFATLAMLAAVTLLARSTAVRVAGTAALALASFFSYANLAIGAFATFVTARREGVRRALALAGACAAGLALFYGLLHLTTGFDPIGALRATELVYGEGVASRRPYGFWLLGSPVAFLVAAGLPIAWLALRALGARETVAVALFAVVAIAALLGFTKAETERIYLFLVPLLCVAAASVLSGRRLGAVVAALAVQAVATELLLFTVW
jgi:hypothetical protein